MEPTQSKSERLLIRPAEPGDSDAVYRFLCELEAQTLDPTAFRAVFRRNLATNWIHYLVAESENQVIGFVSCHVQYLLHHVGKVGEIQELFVLEAHRNQYVGRRLVDALHALARRHGLVNLEVTANRNRTDTHCFYERLGFQPTHYKFVKRCGSDW